MKNVIITGASGFVGRYVLKELIDEGYNVLSITRTQTGIDNVLDFITNNHCDYDGRLSFITKDLNDVSIEDFASHDYDTWIHLAWSGVNRNGVDDEACQKANMDISIHCLQIAKQIGCSSFVTTGSRAECGCNCDIITEEMCGEPLNLYGKYKRDFYGFAYSYCQENNIRYLHLRLFAVTGPGDHPWSLASTCCSKMTKNEALQFGKCGQIWNYLDVRDAARMICMLSDKYATEKNDNCIINIATDESKPLNEFINRIYEITGSKSDISFGDTSGFPSNPAIDKLSKWYDFSNNYSFDRTISDLLEHLRS